jgi:hypothetical protein
MVIQHERSMLMTFEERQCQRTLQQLLLNKKEQQKLA